MLAVEERLLPALRAKAGGKPRKVAPDRGMTADKPGHNHRCQVNDMPHPPFEPSYALIACNILIRNPPVPNTKALGMLEWDGGGRWEKGKK